MPRTKGVTTPSTPSQDAAMAAGIESSLEEYRAVGHFHRHRDLSNLVPGMSGIPEMSREDFLAFRPGSRGPQSFPELFNTCNNIYENVGLIWNIINLMTDFTVKGIRLVHKNKKQEMEFQDWFQRIGGVHISERFVNYLYRLGNVVIQRYTAQIAEGEEIAVAAPTKPDRKGLPKMFIPRKNEIPWKYVFINPASVELIGGPLASFVDEPTYGIKLSEELKNLIKSPKTPAEREIVAKLPPEIVAAAKVNKAYPLEPHRTIVVHFKKDDWLPWARPIIAPIIDEITTYDKLRFADQCILDGASNKVEVFKIGNMEYKIPPSPAHAKKLSSLLETNTGGGTTRVVWGPDLEIAETKNDMWQFLGEDKYKPTLNAIYSAMGVPQTLTASVGPGSGASNNYMSLKTLTERLSYGRALLIDFWEREIAIFQKAKGFRHYAEVEFDQTILANEDTEKQLLIQLCDRNLISEELLQIRFGMKPNMEKVRLNRESRERDAGTRTRKGGQWFAAEPEYELKKIALQSGAISPEQAGLELDEISDKEVKQMEKLEKIKKAGQPEKPPGQIGQGRPPGKKDQKKRMTKKFTPRTTSILWANEAQEKIAEILNPLLLKLFGKANLRQLTADEFNTAERIKYCVLCGLKPLEEVTSERVQEEVQKNLFYPLHAKMLQEKVQDFQNALNKTATIDEIRLIQSEVYAELVDHTMSEFLTRQDLEAAYGYCPKCGSKGVTRERRPNGNDTCENGHTYPSKEAVKK